MAIETYELYTDASVANNTAVATCLLLGSTNYIGYNSYNYEYVTSSLHAELLGILDGLRFARASGLSTNNYLTVYSDSNSAIQIITNKKHRKPQQFRQIIANINKECEHIFVTFKLIKGHQLEHNPNKIVDLTSNTILRYKIMGGTSDA